ncbi:MAG: cysteine desulfurase-like protein, partial [Chloroflexales bacterium]|nr:cysteine desulfurase-like protein [Chloroflexales bacterium]
MNTLDLSPLRAHFPSLQLEVNGRPAVFLDNPAGTQVPQQVIDAITGYLLHANANTGGAFLTSQRTDETIAAARLAMADMLGCDPDEIVFGQNMTTLAFALSRAIGRTLRAGDEIVVTTLDHDANIAPWVALEEQGVVIRRANIHVPDCTLDMPALLDLIGARTRLVAVGYASNAAGTINDLAPIIARAHAVGALVFVDAVQYAPHGPIDVRALGCDFLACSSYKFFGPHLGILYGRRALLESLPAYKVRPAKDKAPDRWETGTKNHECMAALPAIADYFATIGRDYGGSFGDRLAGYAGRRRELLAGMEA